MLCTTEKGTLEKHGMCAAVATSHTQSRCCFFFWWIETQSQNSFLLMVLAATSNLLAVAFKSQRFVHLFKISLLPKDQTQHLRCRDTPTNSEPSPPPTPSKTDKILKLTDFPFPKLSKPIWQNLQWKETNLGCYYIFPSNLELWV